MKAKKKQLKKSSSAPVKKKDDKKAKDREKVIKQLQALGYIG